MKSSPQGMTAPQTPEVQKWPVSVYPCGQLNDADRASLRDAGIVAVEADDPSKVVTVLPGAPLVSADALALSAVEAVSASPLDGVAAYFVKRLRERMQAAAARTQP